MSNASTQGRSVRQVKMYHVGTPPDVFPEEFELASDDGSESWYVRAVRPEYFWIGDEEEDAEQWNRDGFYQWMEERAGLGPAVEVGNVCVILGHS